MTSRILYIVDDLGTRGSRRSLVLTLEHLDRPSFEPEVVHLWGPDTLRDDIERLGVRVHGLHAGHGDWSLVAVPRLRGLIREGRFDLLHTQPVFASIVGRTAGRLARVKVVSDLPGAEPEGWVEQVLPPKEARRKATVSQLESLTGRALVSRFLAPSEAARRSAPRRARVSVVPRGQDFEALARRAALDPDPPIDDLGAPSILVVGRLTPEKGHRYLVDAMRPVLDEFPEARLLVAGDGCLRRMLEDRATPLGEAVTFLGFRSDVPALLSRADLVVFPSLWVGRADALVEAMAVGRPIVATRIPVVVDTVRDGETAALAAAANPDRLADAMLRLLRDPASARAMAERAKEAAAPFDIRRTTRELEAVYREVLSG